MILSGVSGSGKTSSCAVAVGLAREAGLPVAGSLCEAVFEDGSKVGIDWRDLADDGAPRRSLARRLPGFAAPPADGARPPGRSAAYDGSDPLTIRFGAWSFDRAALAEADEATAAAIAGVSGPGGSGAGLVVVDEIGPLELDRGVGMVGALAALDRAAADRSGRGLAVVVARPDIADRLAARWPGSVRIDVSGAPFERNARRILEALDSSESR